jgi:hypothetical protein
MSSIRHQICSIAAVAGVVIVCACALAKGEPATNEAAKLLPDRIQSFQATGPAEPYLNLAKINAETAFTMRVADLPGQTAAAVRKYRDEAGHIFAIELAYTDSDSGAYSLLTQLAGDRGSIEPGKIGAASTQYQHRIIFFRGQTLAQITWSDNYSDGEMGKLAQDYAATLPASDDDDVPVLVKHLPPGQTGAHPLYAVSLQTLQGFISNQPVLDVVDFTGGAEAVVGNYDQSRVVIVEFTTPQLSIDNDSRVWTRIAELKSQGQPTPSAYRRVGNYSVFVFNAPDYKTADALINQVKYEQVVQWLGDDPHLYDKLQKYFAQTSAGVLVAVLKSSGLSLVLTFAIGGLLGALLFRHRRAQRAATFSDAGGSIRLNLDELTGAANSRPLLTSGERSERDPSS